MPRWPSVRVTPTVISSEFGDDHAAGDARGHAGHVRRRARRAVGAAVGVEPVEHDRKRLLRGEQRLSGLGIDVRALIEIAERRRAAARRSGIDERRVDRRDVAREADVRQPGAVAADIPGRAEARAERGVPDHFDTRLILRSIAVVAHAEVDGGAAVDPPRVVQERRVRAQVVADAGADEREPFDERRVAAAQHRIDRITLDDRRRRLDAEARARLIVVVLPRFLVGVDAGDDVVGAGARRGQEVVHLGEIVPVVAILDAAAADRAERRRIEARLAALPIPDRRAADDVGELRAGSENGVVAAPSTGLPRTGCR